MLGAAMGRFVGESLAFSLYFSKIIIGGYAVVGAAAMAAGMKEEEKKRRREGREVGEGENRRRGVRK